MPSFLSSSALSSESGSGLSLPSTTVARPSRASMRGISSSSDADNDMNFQPDSRFYADGENTRGHYAVSERVLVHGVDDGGLGQPTTNSSARRARIISSTTLAQYARNKRDLTELANRSLQGAEPEDVPYLITQLTKLRREYTPLVLRSTFDLSVYLQPGEGVADEGTEDQK